MPTWTAIEDELPEPGQRVKVAADGLPPERGAFTTAKLLEDGDTHTWLSENVALNDYDQVTHWRPL